jgi:saccharopine dehydrogenase (NAD+, L-lysine-forming)
LYSPVKGRVAGGAIETLVNAGIKYVEPEAFLTEHFDQPVYTDLGVDMYNKRKNGEPFIKSEFYNFPEDFTSDFMRFAEVADIYVACHYWDAKAPYIFSREDAKKQEFKIKLVADVSCDIDGPVASTITS